MELVFNENQLKLKQQSTAASTHLFLARPSQGSQVSECLRSCVSVKHWPCPQRWSVSFLTYRWAHTMTCFPVKNEMKTWFIFSMKEISVQGYEISLWNNHFRTLRKFLIFNPFATSNFEYVKQWKNATIWFSTFIW